jgi:hypothetical protein
MEEKRTGNRNLPVTLSRRISGCIPSQIERRIASFILISSNRERPMLDRKTLNEFYYGKLSKLRSPFDEDTNRNFFPANKVSSHREWGRVKRA